MKGDGKRRKLMGKMLEKKNRDREEVKKRDLGKIAGKKKLARLSEEMGEEKIEKKMTENVWEKIEGKTP